MRSNDGDTVVTCASGSANFSHEWSQCDFCFTNFGVILEYLESSITMKKTVLFHIPNQVSHTIAHFVAIVRCMLFEH